MTSEEELKLAKEQQVKNDKEQLEKELSEAGITPPDDDAPLTMKAMKELFVNISKLSVDVYDIIMTTYWYLKIYYILVEYYSVYLFTHIGP